MVEPKDRNGDILSSLGKHAGLHALDPLADFLKINPNTDVRVRDRYLRGYITGLAGFISNHQLVIPIGTDTETLSASSALNGYIRGLRRERPKMRGDIMGENNPDAGGDTSYEAARWTNAEGMIQDVVYGEGYFLGFMMGVARDYDLNLNQFEIPDTPSSFDLFDKGLKTEPFSFFLLKDVQWADEASEQFNIFMQKSVYEAGLKIWLHKRNLSPNLASKISHPEALSSFIAALNGNEAPQNEEIPEDSPQYQGYLLGKDAKEHLDSN